MKTTNVAIVNGISLQVVADEREQLVAVKPVCEILCVAYPPQFAKLKEHPIFGSVITLSITTGADGKEYEIADDPETSHCINSNGMPSDCVDLDEECWSCANMYRDENVCMLTGPCKYERRKDC